MSQFNVDPIGVPNKKARETNFKPQLEDQNPEQTAYAKPVLNSIFGPQQAESAIRA